MNDARSALNNRQFPRLPKEVAVEVSELSYPLPTSAQEIAVSKDISPKGLCFRAAGLFRPGTLLTLKINLPGWQHHKRKPAVLLDDGKIDRPLNSLAEVVWCRDVGDGGKDVGVKFVNIHEDDYQALVKMLTQAPPA